MDDRTKYNLELIRALDNLIAQGQWEGGLFFQAAGKKLRDLSTRLKQELQLDIKEELTPTEMRDYIKQHSGLIEVYISLYSAEGNNLRKWESILISLPKQVISRPIYKREKDLKETLAVKTTAINDAYAVAYISEIDILKPSFRDKVPVDRFGHELLLLKENSLKTDNITKFVHVTGEYTYRKGVLSKLN